MAACPSDGRGGLIRGCRLTCGVGNQSVPAVLIRCLGPGASVTAAVSLIPSPHTGSTRHVSFSLNLLTWCGRPCVGCCLQKDAPRCCLFMCNSQVVWQRIRRLLQGMCKSWRISVSSRFTSETPQRLLWRHNSLYLSFYYGRKPFFPPDEH